MTSQAFAPRTPRPLRSRPRTNRSGATGGRPTRLLRGARRRSAPEALHPDDVPVPVGRPPHRPLVRGHGPDIVARMHRMKGFNVMFPMGFDSLRAAGRERGDRPRHPPPVWTNANIERCAPSSGRWARCSTGRARSYRPRLLPLDPVDLPPALQGGPSVPGHGAVDWCPKDQVVLAREQVLGTERRCWRCGTPVIKRDLEQWWFRITNYSDEPARLLGHRLSRADQADADELDRPLGGRRDRLPDRARRRRGHPGLTTRPDTVFGATFMVLAPEHPSTSLPPMIGGPSRRTSRVRDARPRSSG